MFALSNNRNAANIFTCHSPITVRRKPNKQMASTDAKQRRKSAPPNSLAVRNTAEISAAPSSSPRATEQAASARPGKDRRRQPLAGGTLLKEGKIFKAPQRKGKPVSVPLKQAQVRLNSVHRLFECSHYSNLNLFTLRLEIIHGV